MAAWDVTTIGAALNFDTVNAYNAACKVDANHFVCFYKGDAGQQAYAQVFAVDPVTHAVTEASARLLVEAAFNYGNSCVMIDATHVLAFRAGAAGAGNVQVFEINPATWAITAAGAALAEDIRYTCPVVKVDANHFVCARKDNAGTVHANTYEVDLGTWAVTKVGADCLVASDVAALLLIDANHLLMIGQRARAYVVDLGTWTVSTTGADAGAQLSAAAVQYPSAALVDANHAVVFYGGTDNDGFARTVAIDLATWLVTLAGAALEFDTFDGLHHSCAQIVGSYFINFWAGQDSDGYARAFAVDLGTWDVTPVGAAAVEFDAALGTYNTCVDMGDGVFVNCWAGSASTFGYAQAFNVEVITDCGISTVVQTGVRVARVTFVASPAGPQIPLQASAETEANWLVSGDAGPLALVTAVRSADLVYDLTFDRDIEPGETIAVDSSAVATDTGGLCDDPGIGGFVSVNGGLLSAVLDDAKILRLTFKNGGANTAPLEADALNVAKVVVAGALGGLTAASIVKVSAFVYLATLTRPTVAGEACTVDVSACATVGGGDVAVPGDLAFAGVQGTNGAADFAEALSPTEIRVTFDDAAWYSWPALGSAGQVASWTVRTKGGSVALTLLSVRMESRYAYVLTLTSPMEDRPYEVVTDGVATAHGGTCA